MKKNVTLILTLLMLFVLSGTAYAAPKRVTLLLNGSIEQEFNKMCVSGLQNAKKRYIRDITYKVHTTESSPEQEELRAVLDKAMSSSDCVIVVGYAYNGLLNEYSLKYPNVSVFCFNSRPNSNVTKVTFKEEEGGFLAGALAAMMTSAEGVPRIKNESHKVGIILGRELENTKNFERGFRAGAWYTDPKTEVLCEYTGSFDDLDATAKAARAMNSSGADVIFCAAGYAGHGAINIADELGIWIIGIDTEQEKKHPDAVLASVIKRIDFAVFQTVTFFVKKEGDVMRRLGIKEGCIDISLWTREAKKNIPLEIRERIIEISDKIEEGLIIIK